MSDLATKVQAEYPQVNQWMVEVHYEDPVVGHKIDFATKVALSELGLGVSDKVLISVRPIWASLDDSVLLKLMPSPADA